MGEYLGFQNDSNTITETITQYTKKPSGRPCPMYACLWSVLLQLKNICHAEVSLKSGWQGKNLTAAALQSLERKIHPKQCTYSHTAHIIVHAHIIYTQQKPTCLHLRQGHVWLAGKPSPGQRCSNQQIRDTAGYLRPAQCLLIYGLGRGEDPLAWCFSVWPLPQPV